MGRVKLRTVDEMIREAYTMLRAEGKKVYEIAEILGMDRSTLYQHMNRWDEKVGQTGSRKRKTALESLTVEVYMNMKRTNPFLKEKDIADIFGVTYVTYLKWKKANGIGKGKTAWVR